MITATIIGEDTIKFETTKERLMGLTIYNGCGSMDIYHLTEEDAGNIIKTLQTFKLTRREIKRQELVTKLKALDPEVEGEEYEGKRDGILAEIAAVEPGS